MAVRKDDVVGRLAGDEFVALLIGELEDSALQRFVERIHRVLTEPIGIPGGTLNVSASIGIVQIAEGTPAMRWHYFAKPMRRCTPPRQRADARATSHR